MAADPERASVRRIAVLEDNAPQAKTLAGWLEKVGYEVTIRSDGDRFLELVEHEKFDLLLLDWDVPGTPGIDVLKRVRARLQYALPIMMITQHDDARDIVHGLEHGADDYVVKPADERVLMARIVAQLRKYYPLTQAAERLVHGDYVFDPASLSVTWRGEEQPKLQQREFDLAYFLFKRAGSIVTKDVLRRFTEAEKDDALSALKDEMDILKQELDVLEAEGGHPNEKADRLKARIDALDERLAERKKDRDRKQDVLLATYISRLRNKLQLRAQKSGLVITTVYSYGYRLEKAADSVLSKEPAMARSRAPGYAQ
jgi:two-component system, OmpR family, response regulator RegX3